MSGGKLHFSFPVIKKTPSFALYLRKKIPYSLPSASIRRKRDHICFNDSHITYERVVDSSMKNTPSLIHAME